MGIGQVLTMPLFFASNAIYPVELMPHWLQVLAKLNPLTYLVDALRGLMVVGEGSGFGVGHDCLVLGATFALLWALAVKLYPKLIQ